MGPDGGKDTVVDSQLRVVNVRGLRVIDASVMVKKILWINYQLYGWLINFII